MKTLVIGANGFLGRAFYQTYKSFDPTVIGTHYMSKEDLQVLDLRRPDLSTLHWNPKEYSHVLVCASVSDMWKCEKNEMQSYECNVSAHLQIVEQCVRLHLTPILFSTDYVFDGKADEYTEDSPVNPLNGYGRQKAELETKILTRFPHQCLILRLSKVFSFREVDRVALTQMIQRFLNREQAGIVWDQIFCPLVLDDVIEGVLKLQELGATGLFNCAGSETWSRIDLSHAIAKALQLQSNPTISPNLFSDPLQRPRSTVLSSLKFQRTTKLSFKKISQHIEELSKVAVP